MIRVVLADDHAVVRHGLERLLEGFEDVELVGSAEDGEAAAALAERTQPDVVLLDLHLLEARTERQPLEALTERERDVLRLVAEGLANKVIARRLGISEKTVKTHLTSVSRRIGVDDRTQAALRAARNGLGR